MKLYLLEPIKEWEPWYDKCFGYVMRAETELDARRLAHYNHGDEGRDVWLDDTVTKCTELTQDGEQEIIISDFRWA